MINLFQNVEAYDILIQARNINKLKLGTLISFMIDSTNIDLHCNVLNSMHLRIRSLSLFYFFPLRVNEVNFSCDRPGRQKIQNYALEVARA